MTGLLAIVIAERQERLSGDEDGRDARKTEVILASAGLDATDIARLMGKTADAVRKAIQRGRR